MTKYQNLFMNFWTPEFYSWGKGRDDSTMPWYTRYDYVETYAWDIASGDYVLLWRDDFDFLDTTRWSVANGWSFDNNSSNFIKSNVYVEDGNLTLRMHKTNSPPPANPSNEDPPNIDL